MFSRTQRCFILGHSFRSILRIELSSTLNTHPTAPYCTLRNALNRADFSTVKRSHADDLGFKSSSRTGSIVVVVVVVIIIIITYCRYSCLFFILHDLLLFWYGHKTATKYQEISHKLYQNIQHWCGALCGSDGAGGEFTDSCMCFFYHSLSRNVSNQLPT